MLFAMRYRNIITAVLLFCAIISQAQTIDEGFVTVRRSLGSMFQGLSKGNVLTGYLLDTGVDLVDLTCFNGEELTDENVVGISLYAEILKSIRSCHVMTTMAINQAMLVNDVIDEFVNEDEVNLSFAAYKYNYILPNALEDNLISYNESSGIVSDVINNGQWQNPYGEEVLFAFAANRQEIFPGNVTFTLSSSYVWYNLLINKLEFDAGDGLGYRSLNSDVPITVSYSECGEKELKMRMKSQGRTYVAHSSIKVIERPEPDNSSSLQSGILADEPDTVKCVYNGKEIVAQYSCYCIPGNSAITRPFIVAEGFDPWHLIDSGGVVSSKNVHLGYRDHNYFQTRVWPKFTSRNDYDLIYVDWDDSLIDIRANAELFRRIIIKINQEKRSAGSMERNVVMGQSMGGLVARYALRKMELDDEDHETSTYVSHDVPHWGANVPLGALFFIQQALSYAHGHEGLVSLADSFAGGVLTENEKVLHDLIQGESVRQMLVNYVNEEGILDNYVHSEWLRELERIGFPQKTENVAIVNGAHYVRTPFDNGGTAIFHFSGYALAGWLMDFPKIYKLFSPGRINILAEINPLSSTKIGCPISVLNVNYFKKFFWRDPINFTIFSSSMDMPLVDLYYDDFPGSIYEFEDFGGPSSSIDTELVDSSGQGNYNFLLQIDSAMMFVPTASALAIRADVNLTSSDYLRNYLVDRPIPLIETPFASYILPNEVEEHIDFTPEIGNWLSNQLSAYIAGPDTLSSTANYTLLGSLESVQWKSSDNSKAVIDNNGRLTAIGNGAVEISAESYSAGQLVRKSKKVMIGHPDLAISYCFSPGAGHMFYVSAPDEHDLAVLQELVDAGYLKYEWSVLCDESDIVTTLSDIPSISHLPNSDETVTVCLRLVDNKGNKGVTYSRTVNLRNPFLTNYRYVEVSALGTVTFVKDNTYERGMPSEDFTISFRNITYSPNDNLYYLQSKYIQGNMCYLAYPNGRGTTYLSGAKLQGQLKWRYDFFNTPIFINSLEDVVNRAGGTTITSGEIKKFDICICNANKDTMQRIPFAIIYK